MFTSVRIRNFRQFRDLKLDNLARINLITGQNNTGKTSLLEALWLFAAGPADPGVVSAIARIRGIDEIGLEGASAWGWIFGDHASRDGIVLEGWFDKEGKVAERLQIRQADVARVTGNGHIAPEPETISTAEISGRSLELAQSDRSGVTETASLEVVGKAALPRPIPGMRRQKWYFLSNRHGDPSEEAKAFDRLVLDGHEAAVIDAQRTVDCRVTGARSFNPRSGQRIYVSMKDMAFRPIDVMGHGFYRAGTIATSIISAHQGLALIDEMDDGLHYSTLKDVWRVVLDLAQRHDVQVFATTQSLECVQAAAEAAGGRPDVLALHRLTRRDGDIVVTAVEDEGIRAAVGFGFELR